MTTSTLFRPTRVWLRKSTLDRRARRLNSRRYRAGLVAGLRRMVEAAEEPRPLLTSQVPLNRRAIRAQRELLLQVASDLESADELSPRGVALVERLLTDALSPCYVAANDEELRVALRQAHAALHLG